MKSFLFILAVLSFLIWAVFLYEGLPSFLDLEVKGDWITYFYTIVYNLLNSVNIIFPLPLIPMALLSLVVLVNLGNDIASIQNRIAIALLFLLFTIHGIGANLLALLRDTYLLRSGLPDGFIFLLIDTLIVLVPSVLLLLSGLGYDFRKSFLLSLLPVFIISYFMKLIYGLMNFKSF